MEGPSSDEGAYKPQPGFAPETKRQLLGLDDNHSKDFWLVQWPIDQPLDFARQQVTLTLNQDRQLSTFEGSSGKTYKLVNVSSKESEAVLFLSSSTGSKMVGKITRAVSFISSPDAEELDKLFSNSAKHLQLSASRTVTGSSLKTPRSSWRSNPKSSGVSGLTSSHSTGGRSSPPRLGKLASSLKRTANERSALDSRGGRSLFSLSSGSAKQSHQKKSRTNI